MQYRNNERIELALHGRLIINGKPELRVVTRDIGLRGACLECGSRSVRTGQRAVLALQAEGESLLSLTLSGHVAYTRTGICGLTFDAVDMEDFVELYRLLARSSHHRTRIDDEVELGFVPEFRHWAVSSAPTPR